MDPLLRIVDLHKRFGETEVLCGIEKWLVPAPTFI